MAPTWDISIEYCDQAVYLSSQTLSKTTLIILTLILHIAAVLFFFSIGFYGFKIGHALINEGVFIYTLAIIQLLHIVDGPWYCHLC